VDPESLQFFFKTDTHSAQNSPIYVYILCSICLVIYMCIVPWICTCRWTLAIVGFFGFVNVYALRVNLSVAMVCMINHTAVREQQQQQVQQISNFNSTLSLSPLLHEDHCSISNGTLNIKVYRLFYIFNRVS